MAPRDPLTCIKVRREWRHPLHTDSCGEEDLESRLRWKRIRGLLDDGKVKESKYKPKKEGSYGRQDNDRNLGSDLKQYNGNYRGGNWWKEDRVNSNSKGEGREDWIIRGTKERYKVRNLKRKGKKNKVMTSINLWRAGKPTFVFLASPLPSSPRRCGLRENEEKWSRRQKRKEKERKEKRDDPNKYMRRQKF